MAGAEAGGSEDDRIFGITNIKAFIPITLNMEEHNFTQWKSMFEMHCITWEVEGFLDGTVVPKGPGDKGWRKRDNLIKMWIYNTIEKSILQMVMKKGETATLLWKAVEELCLSNKDAKAIQLNEDLCNTTLGNRTIAEYCHKLKVIYDLLENIGQPIDEKMLVMHTINGLSKIYGGITTFIRHQKPLPSFLDTIAMLEIEETRFANMARQDVDRDNSSSPTALLARGNQNQNNYRNYRPNICRNFQRGHCQYAERCKFIHSNLGDSRRPQQNNKQNASASFSGHQYAAVPSGPVASYTAAPSGPIASYTAAPTGPIATHPTGFMLPGQQVYSAWPVSQVAGVNLGPVAPTYGPSGAVPVLYNPTGMSHTPPPGFAPLAGHYSPTAPPTAPQGTYYSPSGHSYQNSFSGSQQQGHSGAALNVQTGTSDQATTLPQAFSNLTFKEHGDPEWYVDTGATSHLTTDAGSSNPKHNPPM